MNKVRVGITGQDGFIGRHLKNTIEWTCPDLQIVPFQRTYFESEQQLDRFVQACDVVFHLAAVNRADDPNYVYIENVNLAKHLVSSLHKKATRTKVIFASSVQESAENPYGRGKREAREIIEAWSQKTGNQSHSLIIPNVFGPFCRPNYNSFIATFCRLLLDGGKPIVDVDNIVPLIYVGSLVNNMIEVARGGKVGSVVHITPDNNIRVSETLQMLQRFKSSYIDGQVMPAVNNDFELHLFNTFRSYIDHSSYFPVKYVQHKDSRGAFTEIIRLEQAGQVSFSTTVPTVTRGNHFHTRKIERFSVIRGEALIQLRKLDEDKVIDLYLSGNEPSYVDMPIWYTHNIKNIGKGELLTMFWISEPYDATDPDTFYLEV